MKYHKLFILLLLCYANFAHATVFDRIKGQRVAIGMGVTSLHSDTAHHTQTNVVFKDGELFDIIEESKMLHFDKDENQKFKWYKVRASKGQEGWIFGDALAIATPAIQLDSLSAPYLHQKMLFSSGFGEAIVWFATVEGIELKGNQYLHNPLYLEQYLVLTNEEGKSLSLYLSGRGVEGEQQLKSLVFQDINDDKISEIIIEKSALNQGDLVDNRNVEIYTFTSTGLTKVFDESLSLKVNNDLPSPALYKVLEIDNQLIRVSYVDFIACAKYHQNVVPNSSMSNDEFCMEYVTYTLGWDISTAQFKPLYSESRLPLIGFSKSNYFLYSQPSEGAKKVTKVAPEAELTVIQTHNELIENQNNPSLKIWLFVEDKYGNRGYLPAYQVYFGDTEHATVLHDYFNNPPINLSDWKSDEPFLFIGNNEIKNDE